MGSQDGKSERSALRVVIQLIGFVASIGALAWAVRMALKEENRTQLERLQNATAGEIMAIVGLSFASVALNGLIFWVVIRPVHQIRATDVISTNAIATLLAYLPFKLSLIARVAIHRKRDGVPVLTIGAWFGAVGFLMLAVLGPMALISYLLKEINMMWWLGVIGSVTLSVGVMIATARVFYGPRGISRIASVGALEGLTHREAFIRMHAGFDMVASPASSIWAGIFRVVDVLAFAGRFVVAAWILGLPISGADALLLGSVYFLIGVFSPFGMLGTREAGTIGAAALFGVSATAIGDGEGGASPIAAAVVFVTAIEAVVNLGCAAFGVAWLRIKPGHAGTVLGSVTSEETG
ncbi:MAG: lysylphosphatidylglycerol synthase domain-containing protein [Phycisphaerales bacterium]